eukprot:scaffold360410_cov63-Attheya_sp.AAC.1
MEYDLPRARNIDAAPVEMYWTARTRSFLPRPVHGTAFFPYRYVAYVASLGPTVAYDRIGTSSLYPSSVHLSLPKGNSARFRSSSRASAPLLGYGTYVPRYGYAEGRQTDRRWIGVELR